MSSVLPDPAVPGYHSAHHNNNNNNGNSYGYAQQQFYNPHTASGGRGGGGGRGRGGPSFRHRQGAGVLSSAPPTVQKRRAPLDRGVKRTTECPCAVRLYLLRSSDIAARSEFCSLVLGAPSVGINEAVRSGMLDSNATKKNEEEEGLTADPPSGSAVSAKEKADASLKPLPSSLSTSSPPPPIAVQLAWGDTTIWEVAHTALRAVRAEVDAAYKAEQRRLARSGSAGARDGSGVTVDATAATTKVGEGKDVKSGLQAEEEEEAEAEAPYSTPPRRYEVELLTGSVNALGQASIIPLCSVACRQVLPGHAALLPSRLNDSLDYNTALYELTYNLGDPVFVTCKRTV